MTGIFLLILTPFTFAQRDQITTAKIDEIMTGIRNTTYVVLMDPEETEVAVQYEKIVNDSVINQGGKQNVLTDDHPYNNAIREAMKVWRNGKYEFISWAEFEEKRLDPASSFIFPIKVREELFGVRVESTYLVYGVGGRRASRAERMSRIAAVPVVDHSISSEYYTWKLPGLLLFLQAHADYVAELSMTSDVETLKHYNARGKEVKDYTLYVMQDDLTEKVWTVEQIEELYPGEVRIVSSSELHKLLLEKPENSAFLHKAGPERTKLEEAVCRKFIISMSTGECIYAAEDEIKKKTPEGMLDKDFKYLKK